MIERTALIVCGSRDWADDLMIAGRLEIWELAEHAELVIIEGGARGADRIASNWARGAQGRGVWHEPMPAEWSNHRKPFCPGPWCVLRDHCVGAGARRNQAMVDRALQFSRRWVLAFKDDLDKTLAKGGTEDLMKRAHEAGISVSHFAHRQLENEASAPSEA